jgi:CHAT domain-containing protein
MQARRRSFMGERTNEWAGREGRIVVVAIPHTQDIGDLPGAEAEARLLHRLFLKQAKVLEGRHATYANVMSALPSYPWAHFACHAFSDLTNPSSSGLQLQDRVLTVLDLAHLTLNHTELAFLSSSTTTHSGIHVPEDAIHLATAFQLVGYRHVIATLWPVGDRPAVQVATDAYRALAATETAAAAAEALHVATRRLRDAMPDEPFTWAAHIHSGA